MKIFLSYSSKDLEFVVLIRERLREYGHELFVAEEDISAGQDWNNKIKENLGNADIFIPILTENSIKSNWVVFEFGVFTEYVNQNEDRKVIIPVVFGDVKLPSLFSNLTYLKGDTQNIEGLIESIQATIGRFEGRKIAKSEKAEKLRETIETSAADYIQETISSLEKKETSLKGKADVWYVIGFISLLLGVGVASYITIVGANIKGEWSDVVLLAVKATFIILLLLSASKYSFNLAKTYMNESLKNSDRIHAISFGKFYLQVFGNSIDKTDIKEVFREWNLEKKSGFSDLNSNDYDPRLVDVILKTIESVKGNKSA